MIFRAAVHADEAVLCLTAPLRHSSDPDAWQVPCVWLNRVGPRSKRVGSSRSGVRAVRLARALLAYPTHGLGRSRSVAASQR